MQRTVSEYPTATRRRAIEYRRAGAVGYRRGGAIEYRRAGAFEHNRRPDASRRITAMAGKPSPLPAWPAASAESPRPRKAR